MEIGRDKGLKQALMQEEPVRLSSNYYYRMMKKVEEAARQQERKAGRRMAVVLLCASLALVAGGIVVVSHYFPNAFRIDLLQAVNDSCNVPAMPLWVLGVLVVFLLLFDYWMRKAYLKRSFGKK